jgi:hypothetical protein
MPDSTIHQAERRRHERQDPAGPIRIRRIFPVLPISDAQVLNTSPGGVAIRTAVPMHAGERLSFATEATLPPILAEVLACEPLDDGGYRVRCRCLLGGFEAQ